MVEYIVLIGMVCLGAMGALKAFGGKVAERIAAQAETVRTLEPVNAADTSASGIADLPEPGASGLPLEAALTLTTTLVDPGHLVHGGHTFFHAYETWAALVKGFGDTSLEQRWGANGRRPDEATAAIGARKALDAAVASLDPKRDAELIAKGKEIRSRVDKLAGEAQHGTPSDGGNTGLNKISGVWGSVGDLAGIETRLYPSVTKWREAVRQVEKDVSAYMGEVKERNTKRAAEDRLADFKKSLTDQKNDLTDKAKRLQTMKPAELQSELEKALAQAYLRESLKNMIPGRRNALDDWKTMNEAAQREAAVRAKELVATRPDDVRRYLDAHYSNTIKALDQMLSYDPNVKPYQPPSIGPRR